MNRLHVAAAALGAVMLTGVTACGSDNSDASTEAGSKGGGGGMSVSIESPSANASVNAPFTVKVKSSEDLGPTDSGKHHIHLYFDDREDKYEIVESATWKVPADSPAVQGLAAGKHTMHISLRNADHSAAGSEGEETVMLGGAAGDSSAPPEDDDSTSGSGSGGYDY